MRFIDFARRLGQVPEPGQEAALRVLYDGEEPGDVGPEAVRMFGYERGTPRRARDVAVKVWGARGGKSKWAGTRMLHLGLTVDVSRLAPGEHGYVFLVAPKLELGLQPLNYIKGLVSLDARLAARCDVGAEQIVIDRGRGHFVTIQPVAASRGGAGQRGRSLLGALLDETAFFRDESSGVVNDQAIFKALAPRVIDGGQIVVQSTPWARSGLLYDLFRENFGHPVSAIVSHAPTGMLRTDEKILSYVAREYARDPENAAIEFGAQFGAASATQWLDPGALERAVVDAPPAAVVPGDELGAGGDLGFARNSSALVVARSRGGVVDLVVVEERRPTKDAPLRPSVVCREFARMLSGLGLGGMVADRHYAETAREALDETGLYLSEPPDPDEPWSLARQLLRDGRLRLPQHPLLLAQLKGARGKLRSGGGVQVQLQKTPDGRHGDVAAAAVLAIWAAVRRPHVVPVVVTPGSETWERQQRDRRLDAWREQRRQEREPAGGWGDGAEMPGGWWE